MFETGRGMMRERAGVNVRGLTILGQPFVALELGVVLLSIVYTYMYCGAHELVCTYS